MAKLSCYEVYQWPEFVALCKRLGIEHAKLTKTLVLKLLDPDGPVTVKHEYLATSERADG